jgi:hypothetical protein
MSQHPPLRFVVAPRGFPAVSIDDELTQEKASALGRIGRKLEAALQALADFDGSGSDDIPDEAEQLAREALVAAAALALWTLIVQREACGFSSARAVLDDYKVPPDVHRRCGVAPLIGPRTRHAPRG